MIVRYNPLILAEAAIAGGASFIATKTFPKTSAETEFWVFISLFALCDLAYRFWRIQHPSKSVPSPREPLTPNKPARSWSWLISPNGGHLLFIPAWLLCVPMSIFHTVH